MSWVVFTILVGLLFIIMAQQGGGIIPSIILLFGAAALGFDLAWDSWRMVFIVLALVFTNVVMLIFKRR